MSFSSGQTKLSVYIYTGVRRARVGFHCNMIEDLSFDFLHGMDFWNDGFRSNIKFNTSRLC